MNKVLIYIFGFCSGFVAAYMHANWLDQRGLFEP